jgi:hypothetical protein
VVGEAAARRPSGLPSIIRAANPAPIGVAAE